MTMTRVFAAMRAGARGYVLKGASRSWCRRSRWSPRRGHLRPLGGQPRAGYFTGRKPTLAQPFAELTAREQEVPGLIAKALNNAAIGQWLQLAPKTVRNLASSVFAKLQVADRAQAMRRALDEGLGQ
jgi:DNA-binding NarL/FixJ family response regulator